MNDVSASVIVPASRPEALRRLLDSLAAARRPARFECLVVLNGRDEECRAQALAAADRLPGLRVVAGPRPRSLGAARNAAISQAQGDWLCFLDDDVLVPEVWFEALAAAVAARPDAAAFGGPNVTPRGSGRLERCCGLVLASPLFAGPMSRRYRADAPAGWADDRALILCNLAVARRALSGGLAFDETLIRNEENLLLDQLRRGGARFWFEPALAVEHERRATVSAFAVQCFLSGRGRAQMTLKRPSSLRPLYLAPAVLLTGLVALAAAPAALLPPAGAYLLACALESCRLAARGGEGPAGAGLMAVLGPAAQLSYAAGLAAGFAGGTPARRAPSPYGQRGEPSSQRQ